MKLQSEKLSVSAVLAREMRNPECLLAVALSILLMSPASHASGDDWNTYPPGAYCECNEPDAFFGVSQLYSKADLAKIRSMMTNPKIDRRRPVDRLLPINREYNAIGQIYSKVVGGFGTGFIADSDDLVVAVSHVSGGIGSRVTFKVGQTAPDSSRWAYESGGTVIAVGTGKAHWSIIRLDQKLGKKVGHLHFQPIETEEEFDWAGDHGKLSTLSFPGFKDPRFLWEQKNVQVGGEVVVLATGSSGASGGLLVYRPTPTSRPVVIDQLTSAGNNGGNITLTEIGEFAFDSTFTTLSGLSAYETGLDDPKEKATTLTHQLSEARAGRL